MKLVVPFVPEPVLSKVTDDITGCDHLLAIDAIDKVSWEEYPYRPDVRFGIAHSGTSILLKFFVNERYLRSQTKQINGPVWEDSCVEFFVRFDDTGYYNFEFNCIGTPLVGFGKEKSHRSLLPHSVVDWLRIMVEHSSKPNGNAHWELAVIIPVSIFIHHSLYSLEGLTATGNFYKCGDLTPEPHFVAWNFIEAESADFHRPEFFGRLHFST